MNYVNAASDDSYDTTVPFGSGTFLITGGDTVSDWGLGASGFTTVNPTNNASALVQKLTIANGSTLNHHSIAHIAPFANTFGTVVVNAGILGVFDSSISGSVTLRPNARMFADNATVGPLTQQAGADLNFPLRGLSDFNNLSVMDLANLAGHLFVSVGNGYSPQ